MLDYGNTGGRNRKQEQEAEGRKQKAEGRRQKAESRRQKAERGHYEYELRSALFV